MTSQNPRAGLPNESSVFERRSLDDIYDEIRSMYREHPQPWVLGYSGGKDSTATLQLVWNALLALPEEERRKPVYVIGSDTRVETPVVVRHLSETLRMIDEASRLRGLPIEAHKVSPNLSESFWVNMIGRGYPAPTTRFRWCTERMKINPANRFIEERVAEFGEVIMVLGVRSSESTTRMQLMNTYQVKGHRLRRHTSLRGAYVYAPVAEFSTDDIWTYLLQNPSPWGADNHALAAMYRNASQGECPLVIDESTPSCGNSRFGCWVCTVAKRDSSMEAMIDNGEEWMEPLLEFRDWLATTVDPARKHEFRDAKGRDGRVILLKDGTPAARTYKLESSKEMLEKVLRAQQSIRNSGPDDEALLISVDELMEIRRLWRTEREDWDDSVPAIYRKVFGGDLMWPADDDGSFATEHKQLLAGICDEYGVPFSLAAKM
ncbi:MAG: DNA phosphorothioation system sulfurtransferase DndC, partial [Gemmatimonadetes bacterium]|nr:DNA phosphorothioation system sulfurtransferase DndC [Gemmatimonadota bacterium]